MEDFATAKQRGSWHCALLVYDFTFLKYLYSSWQDLRTPCYQRQTRIKRIQVRRIDIFKTLLESLPQSAISLWLIVKYARYSALLLLTFASSIISAATTLSFGLELQWGFAAKVLLLLYRIAELMLRVGLLALASLDLHIYFPFYLIAGLSLLQVAIITSSKGDKRRSGLALLVHCLRCFANSIAFVYSEVPTTKRDAGGQLVNDYTNTIIFGFLRLPIRPSSKRNFIAPSATQVHACNYCTLPKSVC